MRALPFVLAVIFIACLPAAQADASSLSLSGPGSRPLVAGATAVPIRAALVLDDLVCRQATAVPVDLRVDEARGVDATLDAQRLFFDVPAGAVGAREEERVVHLNLVALAAGAGFVEVVASFSLPPECVSLGGQVSGEARLLLSLDAQPGEGVQPPMRLDERTVEPQESATRPIEVKERLPAPLVTTMVAACAAAVMVVVQRLRARRETP